MNGHDSFSGTEAPASSESFQRAKQWIKQGWIAGLISCFMTLVFSLLGVAGYSIYGFNILCLLDVFIILILTLGIYHSSRIASTLMLAYFLLSKLLSLIDHGLGTVSIGSFLFLYIYFQAMRGTFLYHSLFQHFDSETRVHQNDHSKVIST